jgi:chitin deacetylase
MLLFSPKQRSHTTRYSRFFLLATATFFAVLASTPGHTLASAAAFNDASSSAAPMWYHHPTHPVYGLFRRSDSYPPVGSDGPSNNRLLIFFIPSIFIAWTSAYPSGIYNLSETPQEWLDALASAVSAGLIPNISVSTVPPGQVPVYGNHQDPNSQEICSASYQCQMTGDVWNAPDGQIGIGCVSCLI